jgi:HEAT repeat protein
VGVFDFLKKREPQMKAAQVNRLIARLEPSESKSKADGGHAFSSDEKTIDELGILGDPTAIPALLAKEKELAEFLAWLKETFSPATYRDMAEYVQGLREKTSRVIIALQGVADEVERLIGDLNNKDPKVVLVAIKALGQIGDPRAVGPLIVALKDQNGDVRDAAAKALVQIGAPAVEPLSMALRDRNGNIRRLAARVLGELSWSPDRGESGAAYWAIKGDWGACVRIGAPAVRPLIATLGDQNERSTPAAEALVQIGAPAVESLVAALTEERDWHVRQAAARVLGQIGDARSVEPLVAALKDKMDSVCWAAAGALGQIGDARAVEPLIAGLKDRGGGMSAAEALGQLGDIRAVEPLVAALGGPDTGLRSTAAEALGQLGDARAVEPLIAALKDAIPGVHTTAARSLGQLGDARAVEPLIAALKDEMYFVREAVARALGQLGDARAVEPLIAALKDRDNRVGEAAAAALQRLGDPQDYFGPDAVKEIATSHSEGPSEGTLA